MGPLAQIIGITMLPFLELRASIPAGILLLGPDAWLFVAAVAITANIVLGFLLFFFVELIIKVLTKVSLLDRLYQRTILRIQRQASPYVHKYGTIGLALFIGVPLPGSGVYSGVLAAKVLGFRFREYALAMVIGVCIAGAAVTCVMLSGSAAFSLFIR